jgi:hypothetical protein
MSSWGLDGPRIHNFQLYVVTVRPSGTDERDEKLKRTAVLRGGGC